MGLIRGKASGVSPWPVARVNPGKSAAAVAGSEFRAAIARTSASPMVPAEVVFCWGRRTPQL